MIHFGYKDILSYFEEASFPVILLKPDLAVEYMNDEAESRFGRFFRGTDWQKNFISAEIFRKIKRHTEKGESVVVTPPEVNNFCMLVFQPILGENGKIELIRLNVEVFRDIRKKFENSDTVNNIFTKSYNMIQNALNSISMYLKMIKNNIKKPDYNDYFKIIDDEINQLFQWSLSMDYIYELMKRHDVARDTVFNPGPVLEKITEHYSDVEFANMLSGRGEIVYNINSFVKAFELFINTAKLHSLDNKIHMKAYESGAHFVFVITAKANNEDKLEKVLADSYILKLESLKTIAKERDGNLIVLKNDNTIKIMFSIKKHLRSEYAMIFNQDIVEFEK